MYERISLEGKSNAEWRMLRRTGIGGSDAGAVAGLNRYSSPMKVYLDKTGECMEETDSEAVRCGRDLEAYVAERFCEETGKKVRRSNFMYRSVEHPFMIADVDRFIVGEEAGLECKTCNAFNHKSWEKGAIPDHYILQCYHYMAVTGKRTWYIACLIMGKEFVYRKLTWDDALIESLISVEEGFWTGNVMAGVMPKPDGSDVCNEVLRQAFPRAEKGSGIELADMEDELDRREEILRKIEELQTEQNRIEQEIKLAMGESEHAGCGRYSISWSNVSSERLDTKRLKEECPDIYKSFVKGSTSRRFSIKEVA